MMIWFGSRKNIRHVENLRSTAPILDCKVGAVDLVVEYHTHNWEVAGLTQHNREQVANSASYPQRDSKCMGSRVKA